MKAERILGALYGQALGDAMGMPSELWPRTRVKAHFGWIDSFLPGPAENNAACYFNQQSLLMTRLWRCVWQMPCLNATAKLYQT